MPQIEGWDKDPATQFQPNAVNNKRAFLQVMRLRLEVVNLKTSAGNDGSHLRAYPSTHRNVSRNGEVIHIARVD